MKYLICRYLQKTQHCLHALIRLLNAIENECRNPDVRVNHHWSCVRISEQVGCVRGYDEQIEILRDILIPKPPVMFETF